jgi:hypothetical protein
MLLPRYLIQFGCNIWHSAIYLYGITTTLYHISRQNHISSRHRRDDLDSYPSLLTVTKNINLVNNLYQA